jgi:hypothetical protein
MKNDKQHRDGEVVIREVRDRDREKIIAIFNYYAATSYAAYPEIPVNDRFFAFLREGALGFFTSLPERVPPVDNKPAVFKRSCTNT